MESAYRLYYDFWGVELDGLLEPVPEYHDFKYLPKARIIDLLKTFRYPEVALLVRKEYETAFDDFKESFEKSSDIRGGGVVVTGQPGIGMHLSLTAVSIATELLIQVKHASSTIFYFGS